MYSGDDITIIIATIPERGALLDEALNSTYMQTEPCGVLCEVDEDHNGPAATLNALAEAVDTEWLMRLDDDDLLDEDHIEVITHWLDDDADIAFSWCRIEGGGEDHPEDQFQVRMQASEGWEHLHTTNWIPCTAAVRTSLWRKLGGLRDVPLEDWDFWKRALDAGATFRCIPAVTWTYRMNPEWAHRNEEVLRDTRGIEADA